MRDILGSLLPDFSKNDLEKLKNGVDFIGINHYTSFYIKDCIYSKCEQGPGITRTEGYTLRTALKDGVLIGESVCAISINTLQMTTHKPLYYYKISASLFC